jgi:Ras and Rab interactor 2/3
MAQTGTGSSTREYALQLAADKTTVFARSIDNFVCCTVESKETNPSVVMRNVRQFMSGMKNYLLKHGEKEFQKVVERERSQVLYSYILMYLWYFIMALTWAVHLIYPH